MKSISFNLLNESHGARLGKIKTPRGDIDTPAFMPVGTAGTVKAMYIDQVKGCGSHYFRKHLSLIVKAWR